MCRMGVKYPTDKSPYNKNPKLHKHAYTAIYSMLFSNLRYKNITVGEVGILDNQSMLIWREFFTKAKLYGFECDQNRIDKANLDKIPNCAYSYMDVKDTKIIESALSLTKTRFDILIEDSTHVFEDQIRFVSVAYEYIKPGGFIVIEDIFKKAEESAYSEALSHLSDYFSQAMFINANHGLRYSPGWDNDKILVLHRSEL